MALHCVKIPLTETSDLFVYGVDDETITYEVRGEDCMKLEPRHTSKYKISGDKVYFDSRFVGVQVLVYCRQITQNNVII